MRLIESQARMQRLGKIRLGERTGDKRRPTKLETFRFTSPSQPIIESVAAVYGGTVEPWEDAPGGRQWQVTTTTDAVKVIIPPGDQLDQSNELWSGGGCIRRCNGAANTLTGEACGQPSEVNGKVIPGCAADPQERKEAAARGLACKESTRLNVIVPDVQGLGTWLLESHSYYALIELAGTYDFLRQVLGDRAAIPARLRIDMREVKRPGQPTKKFPVPVLEVATNVSKLMQGRRPEPTVAAIRAEPVFRAELGAGEEYAPVVPRATPPQTVYAEPVGFEDDPGPDTDPDEGREARSTVASSGLEASESQPAEVAPTASAGELAALCSSISPYDREQRCVRERGHAQRIMCRDANGQATWPRPEGWT